MDYSYSTNYIGGGIPAAVWVIYAVIFALMIVTYWKLFNKAGQPGWASIIPIYSTYIMLKIGEKPGWWILLFLVPIANIVFMIMALAAFLKAYGKEGAGPVLLALFFSIFYLPYLAFSNKVQYVRVAEQQQS